MGIIGFVKSKRIVYTIVKSKFNIVSKQTILKCSFRNYNSTYILTLGIRVSLAYVRPPPRGRQKQEQSTPLSVIGCEL